MSELLPIDATTHASLAALLRLYAEWGVDCALDAVPRDMGRDMGRDMADAQPARAPAPRPGSSATNAPSRPAKAPEPQDAFAGVHEVAGLLEALRTSPDLPLRRTATHTLEPILTPGCTLMILGDIPDSDEDRAGTPFADDRLKTMLAFAGLELAQYSRMNAIPWRPPGGRDATAFELDACTPLLHATIRVARPRIIASFGPNPLRMLMPSAQPLNRMRGRWTELAIPGLAHPIRLLPMRHPTQSLASPTAKKDAWHDLLALRVAIDAATPADP